MSTAQVKFELDGKYGVSKNGDAKDSVIFRADYDEIKSFKIDSSLFFIGLRNDEWYPLTSNKLVNQQRYESIEVYPFANKYAVCLRDGYIDLIDLAKNDFLIRGVQATALVDNDVVLKGDVNLLLTQNEKLFGVVDIAQKKEILKAKYAIIKIPDVNKEHFSFITFNEGKNTCFDHTGKPVFEIPTAVEVISISALTSPKSYQIQNAKGGLGMYDAINKWFIPMDYSGIKLMEDDNSEIVIVSSKKGEGLYFKGELLAETIYEKIVKSDTRGYVAILTKKGTDYFLSPEGKITLKPNE